MRRLCRALRADALYRRHHEVDEDREESSCSESSDDGVGVTTTATADNSCQFDRPQSISEYENARWTLLRPPPSPPSISVAQEASPLVQKYGLSGSMLSAKQRFCLEAPKPISIDPRAFLASRNRERTTENTLPDCAESLQSIPSITAVLAPQSTCSPHLNGDTLSTVPPETSVKIIPIVCEPLTSLIEPVMRSVTRVFEKMSSPEPSIVDGDFSLDVDDEQEEEDQVKDLWNVDDDPVSVSDVFIARPVTAIGRYDTVGSTVISDAHSIFAKETTGSRMVFRDSMNSNFVSDVNSLTIENDKEDCTPTPLIQEVERRSDTVASSVVIGEGCAAAALDNRQIAGSPLNLVNMLSAHPSAVHEELSSSSSEEDDEEGVLGLLCASPQNTDSVGIFPLYILTSKLDSDNETPRSSPKAQSSNEEDGSVGGGGDSPLKLPPFSESRKQEIANLRARLSQLEMQMVELEAEGVERERRLRQCEAELEVGVKEEAVEVARHAHLSTSEPDLTVSGSNQQKPRLKLPHWLRLHKRSQPRNSPAKQSDTTAVYPTRKPRNEMSEQPERSRLFAELLRVISERNHLITEEAVLVAELKKIELDAYEEALQEAYNSLHYQPETSSKWQRCGGRRFHRRHHNERSASVEPASNAVSVVGPSAVESTQRQEKHILNEIWRVAKEKSMIVAIQDDTITR